ncbi:MAG: peptide ABC transporter substrate-binding protein [Caldilineaceae bacterium]|nr:peptide ABC transporter substrate-binding protein [Caldilineaceae bacterium]
MYKRSYVVMLLLALAAMVFSACAAPAVPAGDSSGSDGDMAGDMGPVTVRYNLATEPPTVDPALSTDTTSSAVIRSIDVGLTRLNPEDSSAEPSLATDWSQSDDGLTWTFNLRTDIPWVKYNADSGEVEEVTGDDGSVMYVTAPQVEYGIKRACDPETASDYAYILYVIDGCEAANIGEGAVDDIAVTALDDATLEISTTYAASFFPQIVSMPTAFPTPQGVIEEFGDVWTEADNIVSNGPYAMSEWIHNDSMQLVKNPFSPLWAEDSRAGNVDVYNFVMIEEASTEFAMYENNELDDSTVPQDQMDAVFGDGSAYGDEGHIAPNNCTYFYGFITKKEAVSDPNVRRALSMAVDRVTLVDQILKGGQEPANSFTNPANFGTVAFDPEVAPWALTEDLGGTGYAAAVEMGKQLMADAGYPDGEGLTLTIGHNVSEGHARIAQAIQAMWTAAYPAIQVNIETQEWGVYLDSIENDAPMENKPDVYRLGWCADYPHANNWVHEVFNPDAGSNRIMITPDDPAIGDLVAEYTQLTKDAQTASPEDSLAMYKRAEQLLVDEMAAIIPIYFYTTVRITKPWLNRLYANDPYFEYWTLDQSGQEGM